jgi:ATPase family associated with various cellular activities (AAA)
MIAANRERWEEANERYLAAALNWLRLTLRHYSQHHRPTTPEAVPDPASWWGRTFNRDRAEPPVPAKKVPDAEVTRARAEVDRLLAEEPRPALATLATLLGLSGFECDTLLLCAAVELDPAIAGLCARAHGSAGMNYPTFGLALNLFDDAAWDVLSPQRGLRHWRLVEINQPAGQPLVTSALRADERVANHIKGLNYLDDRLEPLVTPVEADLGTPLPPSQRAVVEEIVRQWENGSPAVQLAGAYPASKRLVAAHAAAALGLVTYRLPAALLPRQPGDLDNLSRLWERESRLLPLALYLDADDDELTGPDQEPPLGRFLGRSGGAVFLAVRESRSEVGRRSVVLDVEPPVPAERADVWRGALESAQDELVETLSAQFALDVPAIHRIADAAAGDPDAAWRGCLNTTRPRLAALAERLQPRVGWDDIVLPESELALLRQIAAQVAHRGTVYDTWGFGEKVTRGLGVSALFSGPSGTGKTMAAEVVANHLGLDLYRIDLSAVVSKYIGETEKNLSRMFDAAEGGGAILFFDEADALFGKRSEVKDAHDRYANIEINYLLQRMEAYRGLAILATNMRTALDTAFLRRLRFIVSFAFPGIEQRKAIWEKAFPPNAPRGELDFGRLAALQVSGGITRNIALNAAFLAAGAGTEITMPLVLAAARTEFRKLELPFKETDFRWQEARV